MSLVPLTTRSKGKGLYLIAQPRLYASQTGEDGACEQLRT